MPSITSYLNANVEKQLKYIDIKDARKIMGVEPHEVSDDEIKKAIIDLTTIVRFYIRSVPKC